MATIAKSVPCPHGCSLITKYATATGLITLSFPQARALLWSPGGAVQLYRDQRELFAEFRTEFLIGYVILEQATAGGQA